MPGAGRFNDKAQCTSHVCEKKDGCAPPHNVVGPADLKTAKKTKINERWALREKDEGTHASCCGENKWVAQRCTSQHQVFIEGELAFRKQDITLHCKKTPGFLIEGSDNVFIGDKGSS